MCFSFYLTSLESWWSLPGGSHELTALPVGRLKSVRCSISRAGLSPVCFVFPVSCSKKIFQECLHLIQIVIFSEIQLIKLFSFFINIYLFLKSYTERWRERKNSCILCLTSQMAVRAGPGPRWHQEAAALPRSPTRSTEYMCLDHPLLSQHINREQLGHEPPATSRTSPQCQF